MTADRINLYEGLFLLTQQAAMDLAVGTEHIKTILDRAGAEILILRKWDERKLAYTVKGQKRGTYLLSYFKAKSAQVANIDRDCNLSEQVLRAMVLRADHVGDVELELIGKEGVMSLDLKPKVAEKSEEKTELALDIAIDEVDLAVVIDEDEKD